MGVFTTTQCALTSMNADGATSSHGLRIKFIYSFQNGTRAQPFSASTARIEMWGARDCEPGCMNAKHVRNETTVPTNTTPLCIPLLRPLTTALKDAWLKNAREKKAFLTLKRRRTG